MFEHPERFIPHEWYEEVYSTYAQFIGRYAFAARQVGSDASVLDLGCSCGYGSAYLAEAPGRKVVGIDRSRESVAYGPRHYRHAGLAFVSACATAIPLKTGSLDAVVSMELIEHVEDAKRVVTEVKRALKPGGIFIASTPNRLVSSLSGLPPNPYHVREYNPQEFVELLRHAFDEVLIYGQALTPAFRAYQDMIGRVWHNLALIPELYQQVHALRARVEIDERLTGLSLVRILKRRLWRWLKGGHRGPAERMRDLNQEFRYAQPIVNNVGDWEMTLYQVDRAPVIVGVCRA